MHRDGFGFVIPDQKSLTPQLTSKLSGDIFIPPHQIGNAMHGDLVLVEITNVRPDGRAEGRIVRPVHRAHPTVVGIFHYGARRNYVTPLDSKITQEIVIPEGQEFPETPVPAVSSVDGAQHLSPQRTQRAQRTPVSSVTAGVKHFKDPEDSPQRTQSTAEDVGRPRFGRRSRPRNELGQS
jgi:Exoribonuclease R